MVTRADSAHSRAQALLDAHVAFEVQRLRADTPGYVTSSAEDVLDALADHQVADLLDADALAELLLWTVRRSAGSPLIGGLVEVVTDVVLAGPDEPHPISEFVDREQVADVLDQLLALTPLYERALERLTDSPLVGTLAARFMSRIVGEVVATNQEIANKVPGLGSLVSFGTSAASRVKGAADKPFEAILGGSVGKGGAFAVRKLNRIVIDTMRDPVTRDALLQVWDLVAAEEMGGLDAYVTAEEATAITGSVHELLLPALEHDDVALWVQALTETFLDRFGGYTATELLDQLELDRDEVVARLAAQSPRALDVLHESGDLERFVRARLAPFYESEEARALLG